MVRECSCYCCMSHTRQSCPMRVLSSTGQVRPVSCAQPVKLTGHLCNQVTRMCRYTHRPHTRCTVGKGSIALSVPLQKARCVQVHFLSNHCTVKWDFCDKPLLRSTVLVVLCLSHIRGTVYKVSILSGLSQKASCVQVHFLSNHCTVNWDFCDKPLYSLQYEFYFVLHPAKYQRHSVQGFKFSVYAVTKS